MKKILLLFVLLHLTIHIHAQVNEADSLELVRFYNATGGDNWDDNNGWLTATVSQWHGITVNGARVEKIELGIYFPPFIMIGNNLVGELTEVADLNLPFLTHLILRSNQLSGTIPDFINLPALEVLNLSNNQLSGSIPDFSNLPNLKEIHLIDDGLSGNIPNFSNLPVLTMLYFDHNQLEGNIPNFNNLQNLETLSLWNNQLSGAIPNFDKLPNLKLLSLSDNQLSGAIPSLVGLQNLRSLALENNQLSGDIPDFTIFNNLSQLWIRHNEFTFAGFYKNMNLNLLCDMLTMPCFRYAPQANIPIYQEDSTFYVKAGGLLSDNTYTWFKDGVQIAEIVGDSTYTYTEAGTYYCEVRNSIVTVSSPPEHNLILRSKDYMVSIRGIWPGDTNNDGSVTGLDLKNIGWAYGETGAVRSDTSINWDAKYCESWDSLFQDSLNFHHADCNGDGIVNDKDVKAIYENYSLSYNKTNADTTTIEGVPMSFVLTDTMLEGSMYNFEIYLGNADTEAENVSFVQFSIHLTVDNAQLVMSDTAWVGLENSWLGEDGVHLLHIDTCLNQETSRLTWEIAIARASKTPITGNGLLCKVHCIMDVISITKSNLAPLDLEISVKDITAFDSKRSKIPIKSSTPQTITLLAKEFIDNRPAPEPELRIVSYPNPMKPGGDYIIKVSNNDKPLTMSLHNIMGKEIMRLENVNTEQQLLSLPPDILSGVYLLHCSESDGDCATKKVFVTK